MTSTTVNTSKKIDSESHLKIMNTIWGWYKPPTTTGDMALAWTLCNSDRQLDADIKASSIIS